MHYQIYFKIFETTKTNFILLKNKLRFFSLIFNMKLNDFTITLNLNSPLGKCIKLCVKLNFLFI